MKTKIQAVIFDMDGLMFDTERLYSKVQTEMAGKRGKVFTLEIKGKMMGQKAIDAVRIMLRELGLQDNENAFLEEQTKIFVELLKNESETMPGLFELLDFLEKKEIRKGIATSSMRPWVDILLERFKMKDRFEFIVTGEDASHGKPHRSCI